MEKGKLGLAILYILLLLGWVFTFPLTLDSQSRTTPPKTVPSRETPPSKPTPPPEPGKDEFPSNENLAQRNVGLTMRGFRFGSGLLRDNQGRPTKNGLEFQNAEWRGSGFLVKEDGTIVTNYHVAKMALLGSAKFQDGSTYEIRNIKVYDSTNDLAILKISGQRTFPTANLGDSQTAEPRNKVLAVGNPMGMGINITEGIVSQVVKNDHNIVEMIVHTATITSGNSGGPLYRGDSVIGVNTSVVVNPAFGGGTGFGQAMPINKVKNLLQNPQYERLIPLQNAFPRNAEAIGGKSRQLHAENGQVPGKSGETPGTWALRFRVYSLEDLFIVVRSPGRDLAIMVLDQRENIIGLGDLPTPEIEGLFLSSDFPQEILIVVANFDNQPANFGLNVFKIAW